jgi:membrane-associated phospholipid phosphatase
MNFLFEKALRQCYDRLELNSGERIFVFFKEGVILIDFCKKYKHGFVILIYGLLYLLAFQYLEQRHVYGYHIVHTVFDDLIPFCEYFIVPYLLWFPYMIGAIVYFIFFNKNKREYYQLILNLMMGMTIFVIVSYVYPNVQHLRPSEFPRDNIFTRLVGILYQADTPTNVLPSIHVFNSLAIHMAINSCEALKDRKWVQRGSLLLTILIVLSTMFLKQHTVVDVCLGATLALFGVLIFYPEQTQDVADEAVLWNYRTSKRERKSHSK